MESFLLKAEKLGLEATHLGVLVVLLVITIGIYYSQIAKPSILDKKRSATPTTTTTKSQNPKPLLKPSKPVLIASSTAPIIAEHNDVWEERRRRGIANAATVAKQDHHKHEKPFGSSYYYAHNTTKNKGGYADGLRMEDFAMNGPRLLSTSRTTSRESLQEETTTTSMEQEDDNTTTEAQQPIESDSGEAAPAPAPATTTTTTTPKETKVVKDITRYLWDDPGDSSGIATIRIENLPGAFSSDGLAWKDAQIVTVSAVLEGEGLLVIATDQYKTDYRLRIHRLYDRVTQVRTVVKAKRLLVKLHKKRSALNYLGKANLEAWPHPQRKNNG